MTKTIIIEDDPKAVAVLISMIHEHFPELEIVAIAGSVAEGIRIIEQHQPGLVLSDIQLGTSYAFEIFQCLPPINFEVIFISAYEQFAIQAFKFAAVDYLLKPFSIADFSFAIDRFKMRQRSWQSAQQFETLFYNLKQIQKNDRKIALPTVNGFELFTMNEIVRCQSQINYTYFYMVNKQKVVVSRTLKEFDDLLQSYDFLRVHNSHLINMHHVKSYIKGEGGMIIMSDGSSIEVSRRKKEELMRRLSSLRQDF